MVDLVQLNSSLNYIKVNAIEKRSVFVHPNIFVCL